MIENKLIKEIEESREQFNKLMDKLVKDLRRHEKIMNRADKRQKKEYDELQKRLEEVQKLQQAQRNLIDSFIKIIASAIDAKSNYTGGHCERVPEIALMLAEEASKSEKIDFNMDEEDKKRELSIAAWLHDCGKIVTPEYVMDKATKLETIYNRIHEIRTRFEVIYRDLEIEALKRKLNGEDEEEVERWLEKEKEKLQEEFEFIAKCNIGGEFMKDEDIKIVKQISKREWTRHFDDKLGLSHIELQNLPKEKFNEKLPVKEKLLDDKPEHIIKRDKREIEDFKKFKFKVEIPENLYNRGEVYNLTIKRGTLTKEEYFKIQEHVMMTIKMLERLPFPEHLKNVPLYAGAHHETLRGTGYPRRLKGDEIPIPARILAIADVFEALTASDRPYKRSKKLSEAIKILYFMVKDGDLDKDLFLVFLESGIYLEYAKRHLKQDQIDKVDVEYYKNLLKNKGN
jgi:HD-GYP domain-containing protein (c-di-GMP phosphodiesterase class II)